MKQQVIFIHGGSAYSNYDAFLHQLKTAEPRYSDVARPIRWSDTLRETLGSDFEVITPSMPNKENAKYLEWKLWFERHFQYIKDDVVLVGWSQGGYFLTKYLIENTPPFSIKALFLVAAPYESEDFGGEDGGDFVFDTNKVGELSEKVVRILILHSKDDFVVPYAHALKYKSSLPESELVTFTDRNHFLQQSFPEVIQLLQNI